VIVFWDTVYNDNSFADDGPASFELSALTLGHQTLDGIKYNTIQYNIRLLSINNDICVINTMYNVNYNSKLCIGT